MHNGSVNPGNSFFVVMAEPMNSVFTVGRTTGKFFRIQ